MQDSFVTNATAGLTDSTGDKAMTFVNLRKWKDLEPALRKIAFAHILEDNGAATEITNVRASRSSVTVSSRLSPEATAVERIAWGVLWSTRFFLSGLREVRGDLYHMMPEGDSELERIWEGEPPFILWVRQQLSKDDRRQRVVLVALEDTTSAFDAWVEIRHYLETKERAVTQFLSPSAHRVLDAFNPLRPSARTMPNPILYTGAFETNRRRH